MKYSFLALTFFSLAHLTLASPDDGKSWLRYALEQSAQQSWSAEIRNPEKDNTAIVSGTFLRWTAPDGFVFRKVKLKRADDIEEQYLKNREGTFGIFDKNTAQLTISFPLETILFLEKPISDLEYEFSTFQTTQTTWFGSEAIEITMETDCSDSSLQKMTSNATIHFQRDKTKILERRPIKRVFTVDTHTGQIYRRRQYNHQGKLLDDVALENFRPVTMGSEQEFDLPVKKPDLNTPTANRKDSAPLNQPSNTAEWETDTNYQLRNFLGMKRKADESKQYAKKFSNRLFSNYLKNIFSSKNQTKWQIGLGIIASLALSAGIAIALRRRQKNR